MSIFVRQHLQFLWKLDPVSKCLMSHFPYASLELVKENYGSSFCETGTDKHSGSS